MRKKAWFFKDRTVLGILSVMLVFITLATGCPTGGDDPPAPQTYTVTFDADGGSAVEEQSVKEGEKVTKPANPTKAGHTFVAWYYGATEWNFADTVTKDITLKAKWVTGENVSLFTVTFNADGGSPAPANQTVPSGQKVQKPVTPAKSGYIFGGWYKDADKTTTWNFDTDEVTENTTIYAKWTSISELAPYVGVWRSNNNDKVYWLQADGTAWGFFSNGSFSKTTWSTSKIAGYDVTFNEAKTEFTLSNNTYTKNTTKKTPAAATGTLLGTWVSGSSQTVELKADKIAVLTSYGATLTLNYCAETSAVYLLEPETNLVIVSIDIENGKLDNFSKPASNTSLAGIWKLTEDEQDYYWTLDKDGNGTFHTLGASVPVSFTVTEDGKIDGSSYTIANNTLTLSEGTKDEVTLTKVDSVPSGSGYGGDASLHGTWEMTQGDTTMTLSIKADGSLSMEQRQGDMAYSASGIWKADGSTLSMYNSSFGSSGSGMSYTISGSTLTILDGDNEMVFTK